MSRGSAFFIARSSLLHNTFGVDTDDGGHPNGQEQGQDDQHQADFGDDEQDLHDALGGGHAVVLTWDLAASSLNRIFS